MFIDTISYNCYISKVRIQNDLTIRYLMFNTDNLLLNACLGQYPGSHFSLITHLACLIFMLIPSLTASVRRTSQASRSLDSSPANRPLKNTNSRGDRAKLASQQENRKAAPKDVKKTKGDNKPKSPPSARKNNSKLNL